MENETEMKPRWFTPQEVADYFGVQYGTVMKWIRTGTIRHDEYIRPGGKNVKIFPAAVVRLATPAPQPATAKNLARRQRPVDLKEQARQEREALARRMESLK